MLWENLKNETNFTRTENDALTHVSTQSALLDLFSLGGALRNRPKDEVRQLISRALSEDKKLAIKCLFYLRDIRGGQGERKTFREALSVISQFYPKEAQKILPLIPEYGRWDDIFYLDNVDLKSFMFDENVNTDLLLKWLPSENAGKKSKILARKIRKYLGLSSKNYREILSAGRKQINLLETRMTEKRYNDIDYSKIPSKAGLKYKKAFNKHDEVRYTQFLEDVEKGKKKINVKTLYPYEIVEKILGGDKDKTLDVIWSKLPNYVKNDEKAIVVADTSGSMEGRPIAIALSLAMYFAERNKGIFNNKFITFSARPELQEINGVNLSQKFLNMSNAHWDMNTNLQAVFELILRTAVKYSTPQADLPSTIYIVSDMEFDGCANRNETNFDAIKRKYAEFGYNIPQIVFWNVDSRHNNVPVKQDERGVILVSGSSPTTFSLVMEKTTPYEFMLKTLNQERYKLIDKVI